MIQVSIGVKGNHQVEEGLLIQVLDGIGYKKIAQIEKPLPNGKKLVQLDFEQYL